MQITKEMLKRIIKEELEAALKENAVYGPTGNTEVLDPNAMDEYTIGRFKQFGIRNPKEYAAERQREMRIADPGGNTRWSFIINLRNNQGVWGWQNLDNLRDQMSSDL